MSELEREDCSRCGGSGQVTEEACGRVGYVPCPACDNIPEYALPSEIPDHPEERLEQIETRLEKIQEEKDEWQRVQQQLKIARKELQDVASNPLLPDDDRAVLSHLASQVGMRRFDQYDHGLFAEKEKLHREKAELQRYLDHVQDGDDDE